MSGYPIFGPLAHPVGEPPLDPPDERPVMSESVWSCTSCGAPIYRDSSGLIGHVRGPQGIAVLADDCPGATA